MNFGMGNVKSKIESSELLTTTTAPTESGGVITISTSDISGTPKVNSFLAYIDSDNITALYKITAISSGTATLSLIGNVGGSGGGKQLYQHNLRVLQSGSFGYTLSFITEDDTQITANTWETYWSNHSSLVNVYLQCSGFSNNKPISGFKIIYEDGYHKQGIFTDGNTSINWGWNSGSFKDDEIIPL